MTPAEPESSVLDVAARAGWLYYVGGLTQDQIAAELGVSRQRVQRLVSRAMTGGLIPVRLEHKIAACLTAEAALRARVGLGHVRVAPSLGPGGDAAMATAAAAAQMFETFLSREAPQVFAFGTGRSLAAMVAELPAQRTERHRIVSLIGNIAPDGSATFYDVVQRVADRLHAAYYPMPVPLISETPAERELFHRLPPVQAVARMAATADVTFVGVGQMGREAPMHKDGFVTRDQMDAMQANGAVGEIVGGVYDAEGRYIDTPLNGCMGGVRIETGRSLPVIGVAAGEGKLAAIRAALQGRILNGLVTDESTAAALLA